MEFEEEPRRELYGDVAVFRGRYSNRWDRKAKSADFFTW